jgi:Lon protease-like protein
VALLDRYRTPADLPELIPVFPLRGAILLPRSELPLSIFEPRYLAMVEDAMSGSRIIGMIQPGGEGVLSTESPAGKDVGLKRVGCAGRITAYQELPDGRLRIVLSGVARYSVASEEATQKPYRIVRPEFDAFASDLAPDTTADTIDLSEVIRVLKAWLTSRQLDADWSAVARAPLEPLINSLATQSPFGPEEKQALIEAPSLKDRAAVLITLAEMAMAGGQTGGAGVGRLQ